MNTRLATLTALALTLILSACSGPGGSTDAGSDGAGGAGAVREIDPTPEKKDGSPSYEFEADDIERASQASDKVEEYCSGAVSEAQRVGCLSHVDEGDIP